MKLEVQMTINFGAVPAIGQPFAPLTIKTGGRDVVASGTVITGEKANLEFQLAHLRIVFSFVSDGGQPKLGPSSATGSTLNLTLYNFDNSIGSGTTSPLEIGNLQGRRLWLSFMIYALTPDSSKTVHYTFMVGEPT
jgi:hypothetical protein